VPGDILVGDSDVSGGDPSRDAEYVCAAGEAQLQGRPPAWPNTKAGHPAPAVVEDKLGRAEGRISGLKRRT
jgi:hypothetical protein